MGRPKSVISLCDRDKLQSLLDISSSYSDILGKLGLVRSGGSYTKLKRAILDYNLDETKFNFNRQENLCNANHTTIDLADILVKNSKYNSNKVLLPRLCRAGLKSWQCEVCGITDWNGKRLSFHLHHNDGDNTNNELSNLSVLCPNCHSQTENYGGKKTATTFKEGVVFDDDYINLKMKAVLQSGIDCTKLGWKRKMAAVLGIPSGRVSFWLMDYMPSFYAKNCKEPVGYIPLQGSKNVSCTGSVTKATHTSELKGKYAIKTAERVAPLHTVTKGMYRRTSVEDIERIKNEILSSGINCMKWGWKGKIAPIIGISPQKVNQWLERHMPDFYKTKCRTTAS